MTAGSEAHGSLPAEITNAGGRPPRVVSGGRFAAFIHVIHPAPPSAEEAIDNDRLQRRAAFANGVEYIAEASGAIQPLRWEEDGVTIVIPANEVDGLPLSAFKVAEKVWERAKIDLDLSVEIGAHVACTRSLDPSDIVFQEELARCRRAAGAAPKEAIAVTEDVALGLPVELRETLVPREDKAGEPVFATGGVSKASPVQILWNGLRKYVTGSDFARLRYVGFRLQRKEPPSLDVREVFVPPRLQVGRDRWRDRASREEVRAGDEPEALQAAREDSQQQMLSLDSALNRHRSIVFLGDPGSGKTTLLRWLAVIAASGRVAWAAQFGRAERWLPVPLSVGRITEIRRSFSSSVPSVLDAAARYFCERSIPLEETEIREALHSVLSAGQGMVFLDGLDEVRSEERAAIRGWLESFAAQYPRCRFFATSRKVGYSGIGLPGAVEAHVEPFDQWQIETFVRAFVQSYRRFESGEDDGDGARRAADDFLAALKRDARLGGLTKNPFLLSALALMHRSETRLPPHRVQAYEVFARALCETWADARRLVVGETGTPALSYEDEALPVLGRLALAMHEEHPDGAAPEGFVLEKLAEALTEDKGVKGAEARRAATAFLKKAGEDVQILLPRGPDHWGFLHLTFQEFFAAAGLHAQERFEEVLFERLFDPRWQEVLRLGIGYLALVQKRPKKVNDLIVEVLEWKEPEPRAWVTENLQKQVYEAAILAAEAGDSLRMEVRERVVGAAAAWMAGCGGHAGASTLTETIGAYEIRAPLGIALSAYLSSQSPDNGQILSWLSEVAPALAIQHILATPGIASVRRAERLLFYLPVDVLADHADSLPPQMKPFAEERIAEERLLAELRTLADWRTALSAPAIEQRERAAHILRRAADSNLWESEEGQRLLMHALVDDSPRVRRSAAWVVTTANGPFPGLMDILAARGVDTVEGHKDLWRYLQARAAPAGSPVERWVAMLFESSMWMGVARALARSAVAERVLEVVRTEAREGEQERRVRAVLALEMFNLSSAAETAAECLVDGSARVRRAAIWCLARLPGDRTADLWLKIMDSRDESILLDAPLRQIVERWPPDRLHVLEDRLLERLRTESKPHLRTFLMSALRDHRAPRLVGPLLELTKESWNIEDVASVLAAWGAEDAARLALLLHDSAQRRILWTLSEKMRFNKAV